MAARNSRVPTAVEARRGVKTKCERGETRMRELLLGDKVRASAYPAHPEPRMTILSLSEPGTLLLVLPSRADCQKHSCPRRTGFDDGDNWAFLSHRIPLLARVVVLAHLLPQAIVTPVDTREGARCQSDRRLVRVTNSAIPVSDAFTLLVVVTLQRPNSQSSPRVGYLLH